MSQVWCASFLQRTDGTDESLATVYGIDLYPPPALWVPPNCIFTVDDVTKEWTWRKQFDLIHMRLLLGAFTPEERDGVYQACYE
jgi:hypothetical protein